MINRRDVMQGLAVSAVGSITGVGCSSKREAQEHYQEAVQSTWRHTDRAGSDPQALGVTGRPREAGG